MLEWLTGFKTISPARLHQLLQSDLVTAVDVKGRHRWGGVPVQSC